MTVSRRKDTRTPRVLMHKVADIRGGVSVNVTELGGDFLREGSVLSAPDNGICHVVKTAEVVENVGATAKTIKVKKFHNFKQGDFVLLVEKGAAVEIEAVEIGKEKDTIKVKTTLGVINAGDCIAEAKEVSTSTSALKYTPLAITGTGVAVVPNTNLNVDAWVIAVTKGNKLPACVQEHLRAIVNY